MHLQRVRYRTLSYETEGDKHVDPNKAARTPRRDSKWDG